VTHPEIARARAEQVRLVALLKAGHREREGIMLAICDWFREELLIEAELTLYDTMALSERRRRVAREAMARGIDATWANGGVPGAVLALAKP